jgi:putative endopeptidase
MNVAVVSTMRKLSALPFALSLSIAAAASNHTDSQNVSAVVTPLGGVDKMNFDLNVKACDDFYSYANGGWLKRNPVPSDQTSWGSFNILAERGLNDLRTLMESASSQSAGANALEKMVGDFYTAASNEAQLEELGAKPLAKDLADIDALKNGQDVARYIATQHAKGGVLFGFFNNGDFKNPDLQIGFASQGGLGLPDRDYYTRTDVDSQKLLAKYHGHISAMFVLTGKSAAEAQAAASRVIAFETRLAIASLSRVELRNPANRYRLVSVAQANKETPNFNWNDYFKTLGIRVESFSLTSPKYFEEVNKMLVDTDIAIWQDYFRFTLLRESATMLSKAYVDENFDFFARTLRGAKEQRPRWKRVVDMTSAGLGEPVGQLYVAKHFPPAAKAQAMELITDLKSALKIRLENLPWMSASTKKEALAKFATFTPKVGFPDKWRDYSGVEIKPDDLYGNMARLSAFERSFSLSKIGKPTDRSEWGMSPQTVNAYYSPQRNEIVFPAAILQPPFFDPNADKALNYGGIGGVIGHELLHGFDDQGSQFDAKGANRNWWTPEDRKKFEARTAKLDAQASGTKVGGLNINGKLSMGENIADLGGLTVAYDALQIALKRKPQGELDGFTQNQRFYLNWAQIWRRNMVPESLKLMINTGPHSPSPFRTNGPLTNMDTFAQAFACKANDPMVASQDKKVVIW